MPIPDMYKQYSKDKCDKCKRIRSVKLISTGLLLCWECRRDK